MEWINISERKPKHMQEIKVWIDNPYFGSFERSDNAVFLHFDEPGDFYDANEQIHLDFVAKWSPIDGMDQRQ